MKHLSFLLTLFLIVSCGDDTFRKVETLDGFRILAISSSTPEVAPNTAVTYQLIISDIKGGGRVISGTTKSCIDPGIAFGAKVSCEKDASTISGTYSINTTTDVDLGAANLYTGLATNTVSVTVPANIFTGRSDREKFNGVGYITIFTFTVDGKEVSAFKRVVATNRSSLNTNPSGSSILLNGIAIGNSLVKGDKLVAKNNSPQTYQVMNVDGSVETKTEQYQVAWYVSQGKVDKPKSNINETIEYLGDAPTSTSLVLAIVRDERGGLEVVRDVR